MGILIRGDFCTFFDKKKVSFRKDHAEVSSKDNLPALSTATHLVSGDGTPWDDTPGHCYLLFLP